MNLVRRLYNHDIRLYSVKNNRMPIFLLTCNEKNQNRYGCWIVKNLDVFWLISFCSIIYLKKGLDILDEYR